MRGFTILTLTGGLAMAADLPVKTVVLYKNGVGYFERAGELRAGESARLSFKASEMNDVLKSLTLVDRSGGKVAGLRYDSSEPVEKKLAEYPFTLDPGKPISALLDQLKGARLELETGGRQVAGAIAGARVVPATQSQPEREQVTLLADGGELRTYDLSAVSAWKLADPALERQFKDYLGVLAAARSQDKRTVYIDSTDAASRQLAASYMIPTPVWKSSYRLIFQEGAEAMLEGWAIVDNTTGEDWTNVRLAVVSGRPVSFISKLYEPKYRTRPEAELPEDQALAPPVFAGGVGGVPPAPPPPPMARPEERVRARAAMPMSMDTAEMVAVAQPSTLLRAAETRDLGDLFEYRFSQPVTVRKNESAMLPFLQQKLPVRKLLIYADRSAVNPMNAAEINNSTGKTLDGGPITVFDANTYAGEALVETFKTGDKRLIGYGVDLGTRITTRYDSSRDMVREIRGHRGLLTVRAAMQETLTYTIRNVDERAKTLIIEHPSRPDYKLLNQKPSETTPTAYRFEVKLAPKAEEKFAVSEERVLENRISVISQTPDALVAYIENKALSAAGRKQLETILDRKRQIAGADNAIRQAEAETGEIAKDQERLRQNILSLNQVSGQQEQVQRYARDLAGREARLAALRDQIGEERKKKTALEAELNSLIEKMEF